MTCMIKDKTLRKQRRRELIEGRKNPDKIKLVMTLVVKNEEDIIEQNIRFHCAMGCDGFIVSSHNSTDRTDEILEKLKNEGLVLEIIKRTSPNHQHGLWVDEMITLARKKYKADWVINADADEFYYSKDLNLKKTICKYPLLNVIKVDSTFSFPSRNKDFLSNPYFSLHPFQEFELDNLPFRNEYTEYFSRNSLTDCPKVIHKTKGYVKILDGNHDVSMKKKIMGNSSDIVLYHYHIVNYERYEQKARRWADSAKYLAGENNYMKKLVDLYKNGDLKKYYNSFYGDEMRSLLEKKGVIGKDFSVVNFLRYKNIATQREEQ